MSKPFTIAVFASGSGTNFQALVDAVAAGTLPVRIGLLVCDKPSALVVERAKKAGIPRFVFTPKDYESRQAYEQEILAELRKREVDLIVLAGYMRLITETLVKPYYGRMINIHPSLLPSFAGLNAIGQALDSGVKLTGVTVHFVDGGMDTGPIIAQRALEIRPEDTEDTLASRVHPIEHELYPEVVRWISEGRVVLQGRHVRIEE